MKPIHITFVNFKAISFLYLDQTIDSEYKKFYKIAMEGF